MFFLVELGLNIPNHAWFRVRFKMAFLEQKHGFAMVLDKWYAVLLMRREKGQKTQHPKENQHGAPPKCHLNGTTTTTATTSKPFFLEETLFWAQQLGGPGFTAGGFGGPNASENYDAVQATAQGLCLSVGHWAAAVFWDILGPGHSYIVVFEEQIQQTKKQSPTLSFPFLFQPSHQKQQQNHPVYTPGEKKQTKTSLLF